MIKNEFDENQIYKTVDSNFPPIESSFKTRNLVRSNIMDSSNEDSQHWDTFNAEHNNSIRDLQPFDSITHDKNIANKVCSFNVRKIYNFILRNAFIKIKFK